MCGISGIFETGSSTSQLRAAVQKMTATMIHRGPDEDGFFTSQDLALGMRRLKVMDLSTGSQPISNETGDIHVIFNGEIYGFETIREILEKSGHHFKTKSDTEVLVHLYEQ